MKYVQIQQKRTEFSSIPNELIDTEYGPSVMKCPVDEETVFLGLPSLSRHPGANK